MCTARGVTVSSRDVTGGPGALAASSSGLGVTWPSSFRDSQEDKQVLQKQIVPLKEEATPKPGCSRVPGVGVVGLCDLGLKMFRVCGPRAPFSLLSEGQSSQPALRSVSPPPGSQRAGQFGNPRVAVLGLLKTGNFKQSYFLLWVQLTQIGCPGTTPDFEVSLATEIKGAEEKINSQ